MKMAKKRKTYEFLVINLIHVLALTVVVNRARSPKLWAIAHEKGHKAQKGEFLVINLRHVSGFMVVVNGPQTHKTMGNNS